MKAGNSTDLEVEWRDIMKEESIELRSNWLWEMEKRSQG